MVHVWGHRLSSYVILCDFFCSPQSQLLGSHRVKDVFTSISITQCSPPSPLAWLESASLWCPSFCLLPPVWLHGGKRDLGNLSRFTPISFTELFWGWALVRFLFHFVSLVYLQPLCCAGRTVSENRKYEKMFFSLSKVTSWSCVSLSWPCRRPWPSTHIHAFSLC